MNRQYTYEDKVAAIKDLVAEAAQDILDPAQSADAFGSPVGVLLPNVARLVPVIQYTDALSVLNDLVNPPELVLVDEETDDE